MDRRAQNLPAILRKQSLDFLPRDRVQRRCLVGRAEYAELLKKLSRVVGPVRLELVEKLDDAEPTLRFGDAGRGSARRSIRRRLAPLHVAPELGLFGDQLARVVRVGVDFD